MEEHGGPRHLAWLFAVSFRGGSSAPGEDLERLERVGPILTFRKPQLWASSSASSSKLTEAADGWIDQGSGLE